MACDVFRFFNISFTLSVSLAQKWSHKRRDRFLNGAPGLIFQMFFSHSVMLSLSIQPLEWQCTNTPGGTFSSFGIVFSLKITIGFSLKPSAMQASTKVKWVCSWPVVLSRMVFLPINRNARIRLLLSTSPYSGSPQRKSILHLT